MRGIKYFVLLFAFIILLNFTSSATVQCDSCSDCSTKIASANVNDIIQLNTSISNHSGDCININVKSNLTFDCLGNTIDGNETDYGIYLNGVNYTTIRNCSISNFSGGLFVVEGINNTLLDIITSSNSNIGVYLYSNFNNLTNITSSLDFNYGIILAISNNNTLSGITVTNSSGRGISIQQGSHNNILSNIISNYNGWGIHLGQFEGSNNNRLSNITVNHNAPYGILLTSSSNNNLSNVIANSNYYGIYLESSSENNSISNVNSNLSTFNGVSVFNSIMNNLSNIVSNSNEDYGIVIYQSNNNTLFNISTSLNKLGIVISSSSYTNLSNSTASYNSNSGGISFGNSNNSFLSNLLVFSNSGAGFVISGSLNNTFRNNNMSNNTPYNFRYSFQGETIYTEGTYFLNDIDLSNIVDYNYRIYYNISVSNYEFNSTTTPDAGTMYCMNCTNVTYRGLNLSHNNQYGLYFHNTANSRIEGITSNLNDNGIYLSYSTNNTLSNITTSLNLKYGIYLFNNSNNNSLLDILSNANSGGIALYYSFYNYLDNLTLIDNTFNKDDPGSYYYGSALIFSGSHNNTLNNSQIRRNYNIAFYFYNSSYNVLTGNIIENQQFAGLRFAQLSVGNLLYNNFFNSTTNYNQSGSVNNFFNTTKTLGTNIVGGDYIGGNFWGLLNSTGFSETCTDSDGDDICDVPYNLSDGSYDYLPLRLISFTLPDLPESVYSPKKSNSGGFLTPAVQTNQETQSIPKISAGSSASVSVKNSKIDIRNIKMSVNSNITNASLTVEGIEVENFTIPFPSGNLYKAFSITTKAISNEQLDNVTIDFRVNKTKLAEFNASYENVLLYRVPSNESLWQQLPTVSISDDNTYYYFSSISPGFSSFIIFIAEENIQCEVSQTRCFNDEVQICSDDKIWATSEICDYGCNNGKCINFFSANVLIITYSVAGFILITIIFYYAKKNYKHEKKIPVKKNKISYNKNNKLDKFIR